MCTIGSTAGVDGGEGRKLPPTTVWQQFLALLSAPAVEPRVLSCNTGK